MHPKSKELTVHPEENLSSLLEALRMLGEAIENACRQDPGLSAWDLKGAKVQVFAKSRGQKYRRLSRGREAVIEWLDLRCLPAMSTTRIGALLGLDHTAVIAARARIRARRRQEAGHDIPAG